MQNRRFVRGRGACGSAGNQLLAFSSSMHKTWVCLQRQGARRVGVAQGLHHQVALARPMHGAGRAARGSGDAHSPWDKLVEGLHVRLRAESSCGGKYRLNGRGL